MKFRLGFLILLLILVLFPVSAFASTWAKSYGGSSNDRAYSIQETSDGGFIVAGDTESFGSGQRDIWVLKLDANGNVIWQKTYGDSRDDFAFSIQETSDGGFIVAGGTRSLITSDIIAWVLKLDVNGNVIWQKTYGGSLSLSDYFFSIQETSDGGFIVAGDRQPYDISGSDYWVLKLDPNGNVIWQKTYGGSAADWARSIQETSDGGFIVAGGTYSYGAGFNHLWVLKLDTNGNVIWQKIYSGFEIEYSEASSIQETSDGGFIVAGTMYPSSGNVDYWVLKLDVNGNVIWQKTYGHSLTDSVSSIQETSDGGFIVAGLTGHIPYNIRLDYWVLKLDANGNVIWQKTYGGSLDDYASSVQETSDGGFIVAGSTYSYGAGAIDAWVLKLDANGNISGCDLIQNTSVVPANTNYIPGISDSIPVNTDATVTNTSVEAINTDAYVEEPCPYLMIMITSPNGAEELNTGDIFVITWASQGNIDFVNIEYSTNNGTDWIEIVANIENDGSYDWKVPNNPSDESLIRISDIDGEISDESDVVFTIAPSICQTDFNDDGKVDNADLNIFSIAIGETNCTWWPALCDCDTEGDDNDIDGADLAVFAAEFGRSDCP